jgi:diaminopimelate decarboxylase
LSSPTERDERPTDAAGLPAIADALRRAAAAHGTPAYVTDLATLDRDATAVRAAFPDPWRRQYSVKANDVPAIVAEVTGRGFGANVVSRGEWAIASSAGVPNDRITLEGVGKTDADLRAAIRAASRGLPVAWVALESADEAAVLTRMARRAGLGRRGRPPMNVLVRLNPDVVPETIPGLAVGAGTSKFGLTETEATALIEWLSDHAGGSIRPRGIQLHVGSQLRAVDAWRDAVRLCLAVVGLLRGGLDGFDTLDVGGGFPVMPLDEPAPGPERFARELPELLDGVPEDRRPAHLAIEPGRALVARSGWLVARVLHVRERGGPQVVIDAGMTELIRPALYGARHPIVALTSQGRPITEDAAGRLATQPTRVEGPICESTDALGQHDLPPLRRGDLVAISDAGAYAASLASTYNGRPRAPQVFLELDGRLRLARRAGSLTRASR